MQFHFVVVTSTYLLVEDLILLVHFRKAQKGWILRRWLCYTNSQECAQPHLVTAACLGRERTESSFQTQSIYQPLTRCWHLNPTITLSDFYKDLLIISVFLHLSRHLANFISCIQIFESPFLAAVNQLIQQWHSGMHQQRKNSHKK